MMKTNRFLSLLIGITLASLFQSARAAKIVEVNGSTLTLAPSSREEKFSAGELANVFVGGAKQGMVRIKSFENGQYQAEVIRGSGQVGAEVLSNDDWSKRSTNPSTESPEVELKISVGINLMPGDGTFPETEAKSNDPASISIEIVRGKIRPKEVTLTIGKRKWKSDRFIKTPGAYQLEGAPSAACGTEVKIGLEFTNEMTKKDERRLVSTHIDCQH